VIIWKESGGTWENIYEYAGHDSSGVFIYCPSWTFSANLSYLNKFQQNFIQENGALQFITCQDGLIG
jgi:hypothetical protein